MKMWIQSYSGKIIDVQDPKPSSFTLEDVAQSLALKCRFTGHCRTFYSVSEHCVRGAEFLLKSHGPKYAFAFLCHEFSEVAMPDVATPLKRLLSVNVPWADGVMCSYKALETRHEAAILKALDVDHLTKLIHSPEVLSMDLAMLEWERRDLLGPEPAPWWPSDMVMPPVVSEKKLRPWSWQKARQKWLSAFAFLEALS